MRIWIARDDDGELYMYTTEPIKENDMWIGYGSKTVALEDMGGAFNYIKGYDKPIEYELKEVSHGRRQDT